jgi:acetyl esterase/lipase
VALLARDRGGPALAGQLLLCPMLDDRYDTMSSLQMTGLGIWDEDVAYATRIRQAGGVAELHGWPGGFHGFAGLAPDAAISRAAIAAPGAWLRRLLAGLG